MSNSINSNYDEIGTPNNSMIRGIDLAIDEKTQVLCQTYNNSSGATRSVLYVLMLVNIISLIAVFNSSCLFNWNDDRLTKCTKLLQDKKVLLKRLENKLKEDSIHEIQKVNIIQSNPKFCFSKIKLNDLQLQTIKLKDEIESIQSKRNELQKASIDNFYIVKVNFIGIAFDINQLELISGLAMIILLTVLRFTVAREKNNLRIAFNSISERYQDDSDENKFKNDYEIYLLNKTNSYLESKKEDNIEQTNATWTKILVDINFVRRRYHYNFLSMNEVFNLPKISISRNNTQSTFIGKLINEYLFYFPTLIYSYILFNDFCTLDVAIKLNFWHTITSMFFSALYFILVANLCYKCVSQKLAIIGLFKNFYENKYTYLHKNYERKELSIIFKVFIPLFFLIGLFGLSIMLRLLSGEYQF